MKIRSAKYALGVHLSLAGVTSNAAPQWCQGTVVNLFVYSEGSVYVRPSFRNDYVRICNLNADLNNVSVATCVSWFSILKSATQRQATVLIQYADAPSCDAIPTYGSAPMPGYVMQMN